MGANILPMAVTTVAITTEQLEPIVDTIVAHVGVILPIGIAIMGILISIGLVPRILGKFTHS